MRLTSSTHSCTSPVPLYIYVCPNSVINITSSGHTTQMLALSLACYRRLNTPYQQHGSREKTDKYQYYILRCSKYYYISSVSSFSVRLFLAIEMLWSSILMSAAGLLITVWLQSADLCVIMFLPWTGVSQSSDPRPRQIS